MSDVRSMKAVGTVNKEISKQLESGYHAQGFALAQTMIGIVISQAQNLARCVFTAFDLDPRAREEAVKELKAWQKNLTITARENGNLTKAGFESKDLGAVSRSAAVRVSEFTTICNAMNAGMTRETLSKMTGVSDYENVSFHVIVQTARKHLAATANASARIGRPADPFEVKLAKWLASQKVEGHDAEVKERAVLALQNILPAAEGEAPAEQNRRSTDK